MLIETEKDVEAGLGEGRLVLSVRVPRWSPAEQGRE